MSLSFSAIIGDSVMVQEKEVVPSAEKQQAEAMSKIGTLLERALPRDVKEFTEKYVANMEPQFIDQTADVSESGKDEVAVLDLSTAARSVIDAIPGEVTEIIPGKFTREGLPVSKRWLLAINPVYSTDYVYELTTGVPLEEYEAEMAKKPKSGLRGYAEAADQMLRAGGAT